MLNKRALVTGSSSGIGKGIAEAFAREGAVVTVCGRNRERTEACREAIAQSGHTAYVALGDVGDPAAAELLVDEAVAAMGGLDVVVNCAGGGGDGEVGAPVHEYSLPAWERTVGVHLTAPFVISKAAIPHMLEAGGGALLHISSVCSITVWRGEAAYSAAKAGLNMLSDHIAVEYGERGIRSNTLLPGLIVTPPQVGADSPSADNEWGPVLDRHPIGRFGEVEEVAEAALFLCSDESRFLTGANVPIDGAYSRV
jgi:NAD(P)-dependent dehydrogenase (short-subunit alcohol dehydrogenase family)